MRKERFSLSPLPKVAINYTYSSAGHRLRHFDRNGAMQPILFLLVFIGGGLGSVARYLMSTSVQQLVSGAAFPFGTLSVNMLGCLVIGTLGGLAESKGLFTTEWRAFLFVGILGGFTTFSSFGFETFQLFRDGEIAYAFLNGFGQLLVGFVLVWFGFILGRLI